MMRKHSGIDPNAHPSLDNSRHARTDHSTSKTHTPPLDYSAILHDRHNKKHMDQSHLNTPMRQAPNKNYQGHTPVQLPQQKDRRRNETDENKFTSWTPSNGKVQSPRNPILIPGNRTHRDFSSKPQMEKMTPFQEYNLPYPLRPVAQERPGTEKSLYKKVKSSSTVQKENTEIRKFKEEVPSVLKCPKKQKFFQYILKYSYRSKKGVSYNNPGKVNQDAYVISTSIGKKSWQHYFGVCDGHGSLGHQVSSFIKTQLPQSIQGVNGVDKPHIKDALFQAFKETNQKLVNESGIDLGYSGSTVVGCYLNHNKLYCCNVGDSRAITGSKRGDKWEAKALSIDHKPSQKREADRIQKKGRVQQCKDSEGNPVGPLRVWLKNENAPGLAMTRSFGDLVAASVGVSWEPEITEFTLSSEDKIIIIASDGVWEFLQNEDIISKLSPFYERNEIEPACDFLLDYAVNSWTCQSPVVDDISFVMIFMGYTP